MKYLLWISFVAINFIPFHAQSQIDSTLLKRVPVDTSRQMLNMDATYNRPFLQFKKIPISIGGYLEADYQYMGEDGVTDGHSFSVPRMTLFLSSSIHKKIKFLSEIEFEEGGDEISIEFAAIDINFHPLINLRGGIVMNPIGAFNQNHDGPKWEFVSRPISAAQMLPATWSNPGFGMYGKYFTKNWAFGYEAYLTNGFNDAIINNEENKTFLPASKEDKKRFNESLNGEPLYTLKVAISNFKIAEIGISYMGGIYNTYEKDGLILDKKRKLDVFAVDFNTTLPILNTYITGEWSWIQVDIPNTFTQQFGEQQKGGFVDFVQPIFNGKIFGFDQATFNLAMRLEYVDWNDGRFIETGGNIGDQIWALVPAISFRPTKQTVIRFNYRYMKNTDLLGNPPSKIGGIQLGISSYF